MKIRTLTALVLCLSLPGALSAAIVVGDALVVDFGKGTELSTGNWNNLSDAFVVADAIRFSDGAATGVSFTLRDTTDGKAGIGGATVGAPATTAGLSFGNSGIIPQSALIDLAFFSNEVSEINEVVISGLDDSLLYNLEWVASINTTRPTIIWSADGQTIDVDPSNSTEIFALYGLRTDGAGNLTLNVGIENDVSNSLVAHINALELSAIGLIPEPSTYALLGAGFVVLLVVAKRRRR